MFIGKLRSLLSSIKGAAAAVIVIAAATGTVVAAANEDVQNAVSNTVDTITRGADSNKPAVVAARNDADKKLRSAFQDDHQKVVKLHSAQVQDRAALNDAVNKADKALRDRLTKALDDVAALTLGRNGHESPKPTGSPDIKKDFTAETQTKIDDVVKTAILEMDEIAKGVVDAVAKLTPRTK
jgi:hypothetical protein